ncbi:MAG: DUF4349 domain-containing protein [Candidatus Nanohaloarchaea archaeon]|nr:DUF4349 domain-containing protein [Candidatus Nanohaloarchaea archaeon]
MNVDDLVKNRFLVVAVALAAVLVTGVLVQGTGVAVSGAGGQPQVEKAVYDSGEARSFAADTGGGEAGDSGGDGRMRVTRVRMDINVPDVQQAQTDIETLVNDYDGFVQDTSIQKEFGDSGRMEVRIPEQNRTVFAAAVEERWEVDSRDTSVNDVTRRHTELSLELKNKRQELRRLEQLMNRTDDVENLIKIQKRMGELRTRIQFLENEIAQLEEQVEYATVTISMEEASAFESRFELRQAVTDAYRGALDSVNLMIVGTGYLLPFAVLFALLYLGKRKWEQR